MSSPPAVLTTDDRTRFLLEVIVPSFDQDIDEAERKKWIHREASEHECGWSEEQVKKLVTRFGGYRRQEAMDLALKSTTAPQQELADTVAEKVLVKLEEKEKAKKGVTVAISSATRTKVESLFGRVGFRIVTRAGPMVAEDRGIRFDAFSWRDRSEDDGLADARTHIEDQMRKFGVLFGEGGYKIVDVHTDKQLLNVDDDKIGVIRGGTDIAIVPFETSTFGVAKEICVLWEIKTEKNTSQNPDGLRHFISQAFIELLAARCLSDQPGVLVVLTNLVSGAIMLKIEYNEKNKTFNVVEYEATLDEMGRIVAKFLSEITVPDASFQPLDERQDPREVPVLTFKKTKLSHDVGVALEHFNEMVEDTKPNSIERAYLVEQLFRSMDVPRMPSIVHHSLYS